MTLTVHHLQISQSERVVWLCEELGIDYELKNYKRDPVLAPANYKALHPLEAAPVINDNGKVIGESAACLEYIAHVHGDGKFFVKPGAKEYADFLYYFHFANGSFQPSISRPMMLMLAGASSDNLIAKNTLAKNEHSYELLDKQLQATKYITGPELTAADIMLVFTVTTMRQFVPSSLGKYPNVLRWLKDCAARPAYRKAMQKGDPEIDVEAGISAEGPPVFPPFEKMYESKPKV